MNRAAIDRRLKALEIRSSRGNRPTTAFVIWEHTREEADATLKRAMAEGVVKVGDPIVMGVIPKPCPLPAIRWTDIADLSLVELEHLAEVHDGGRQGDYQAARSMSDADLHAAIVERLPRAAA
ncbi:hypothetical protein [Bosea sp. PAMC 26642]|uniref:hypothetical protein n=1 Tax=Bosea sp. (strain PAMC 26642) TaxID=1792307 RepID=UPI00076FF826|nr:hypothetical protein [Bosea sp. PAMC 26642]AMJ59373.1 hypothetical protein AXW83_02800 [Bosea sp. PAMC 26642]